MDSHVQIEQHDHDNALANPISMSKYSNRVEIKTLLERSDGGAGLVGERVVIGGWVKSSRAMKQGSPTPPPPAAVVPPFGGDDQAAGTANDRCTKIFRSKISIFRKVFDALCGGVRDFPSYEKPETVGQKAGPRPQPLAYTLYFLISDGSSVSSLQVVVDSTSSRIPANQLMALGTCIVAEGVLRNPTVATEKHAIELKAEKLLHVGTVDPEKYPLSKKQLPLHILREYSYFRPRTTTVKDPFFTSELRFLHIICGHSGSK